MAVGRISGPLLTENLERNGIDLSFRDTLATTSLLKLHVTDGKISVARNTATETLDITSGTVRTTQTTNQDTANLANLYFENNNEINVLFGDITFASQDTIQISNFETDNIAISDNTISTYNTNANIDIRTNGTGTFEVVNDLNVAGSIHATGNITLDGNITFGDAISQDTVDFDADVTSDITPSANNNYVIGTAQKKWAQIWANNLNVTNITGGSYIIGGTSVAQPVGNIFYVAENGLDTNRGDHPNGAFATIKQALDAADGSTDGPVVIYVYPGTYQEQLPLTVPSRTAIVGIDFRNVIITPDGSSSSKDVFLLNGETTVQNLTIKDFYYDSINDTGYAFKFAPNTVVTTRSPYVQNVTVITKGSVTSASDPRGFAQGDAGKGALIDGADVLSASEEASMLFHSVTFITPGVDAVTMTNGVRVEWLNSFTYFANRGLYAKNGVTGHLSTDGSTTKYGAEIRSIGSANVYGNYGAVADGADCLMYLIQHNFAYVGVGKYVDNDPSRVIQTQEVTELNSGRVYYQSIDHRGNYRVGNEFVANQDTGETSLILTEADVNAINGMRITTGTDVNVIDGERIIFPNFLIEGNTVETTEGTLVLDAAGTVDFNANTYITQNLDISGNLTIGGALITLGNQATDTVTFAMDFSQNIDPDDTDTYDIGSVSKVWTNGYFSQTYLGDTFWKDNYITSTGVNQNLELRANGTGIVYIESNDLRIDAGGINVLGTSNLQELTINGTLIPNGNFDQQGDVSVTGNMSTTHLTAVNDGVISIEKFNLAGNAIYITQADTDFDLRASGTGNVNVSQNDLDITKNLSANNITATNIFITDNTVMAELVTDRYRFRDNFIESIESGNADLDLAANGTGKIRLENLYFDQQNIETTTEDIVVSSNGITILDSTSATKLPIGTTAQKIQTLGSIRFNSQLNLFESYTTGSGFFGGVYDSDADTSLQAHPTNNTLLGYIAGDQVMTVNSTELNIHGIQADDVRFNDNVISTVVSNSDLELVTPGTGHVKTGDFTYNSNAIQYSTTGEMVLSTTDNGYIKFAGTKAIKIPAGTDAERGSTPVIGETRWNTQQSILETYTGTQWVASAGGGGETVTEEYMTEEGIVESLIFG